MPPKSTTTRRTPKPAVPTTTAQRLGTLIKSARDVMRKDKGLNGDLDRLPMLTWVMFLKFLDDLELQREQEAKLAGRKFRPAVEAPYRWRDWAGRPDGITGDELLAFVNHEECRRPDGSKGAGLFAHLRSLTSANGDDRRDVIATVFRGVDNRMRSGYLLRDVINRVEGIHFTSSDELHTLGHLYESMLREMRDAAGDAGEFYTPRAVVRFMVAVVNPCLGETVLDPACGTGGFLVEALLHLEKQVKTIADRRTLQAGSLRGFEAKPLPFLLCQMNLLLHGLESPQIDPGNALRFPLTQIGERDRVDVILTNPPFGGEEERGVLSNFPEDRQTAETALLFLQLIMRRLKRSSKAGRAAVVVPESVMSDRGVAAKVRQELVDGFNLHTIVRLPKGVFEPYSDIQTNLLFFDRTDSTKGTWYYEHRVPEERQGMQNPCYTQSAPLRFEELRPLLAWWSDREATRCAWHVDRAAIVSEGYSLDFRNPHRAQARTTTPSQAVEMIAQPIDRAVRVTAALAASAQDLDGLRPETWKTTPLGTFLTRAREEVTLDASKSYRQVTVRLYGKGAVLRRTVEGQQVRTRPQFIARTGQLIMSRIDARNGAFALVPQELDGAIVTQDFPLFEVDRSIVEPDFIPIVLRSQGFLDACRRASRGTTNRKRLKEAMFVAETIALPDRGVQKTVVAFMSLLDELIRGVDEVRRSADDSVSGLANLLLGGTDLK